MPGPVLQTFQLSKSYGPRLAVDGLDLAVEPGEIFGFPGPNGAGKTTTIRMALGLIRPSAGRVEVLGKDVRRHRAEVLPRVGALVESPALYSYLNGRDNLRAVGNALGGVPRSRIDEVLELVELAGRGDKVRAYSLGMKQRLGIAMALLNDPELLILDEPANGLDPQGVVDMRELLRRLAAAGKTVFISSHILSEVQQVCSRVAILNLGRLVKVATISALTGAAGEFEVAVDEPARVLELLRAQGWGRDARLEAGLLLTGSPTGRGRDLVRFLAAAGVWPDRVVERQRDLEDIFLDLTHASEAS
ncbi:MAG: ABC transporter ATP-binding protein [Chloroflexi bacterium]|nr:MAG: ABC transporter ATP-binding protein [Chloroflexota bacterium]